MSGPDPSRDVSRGIDWIGAHATPKTYGEILAETRELADEDAAAGAKSPESSADAESKPD